MAEIKIVIPARYAATRLPGKPLHLLAGEPMIVHTARRAAESGLPVWVAYDDARIGEVLAAHGIDAIATSAAHENGTQRLSEVVDIMQWADDTLVVNVQGDEPLLPAALITEVAACLQQHPEAAVATLAAPFQADENPASPNMVKVVSDLQGYALYFSRSLLPCVRDGGEAAVHFPYRRHIGIYAYRAKALRVYPSLCATPLEQAEKLEQLRFLEHGYKIAVQTVAKAPPAGVDSPEDAVRVDALLRAQ